MPAWTFEEFVIAELALVGLWAILHIAFVWLMAKGVLSVDDGRR